MRHTGEKSFYFEVYDTIFIERATNSGFWWLEIKYPNKMFLQDSMELMVVELVHKEVLLIRCPGLRRHIRK